ncbi:MAG: hypothetical protein PF690_12680 [Deltaproteobacteria bacterium]|nr:hypothetical protein [Deltaproteobacteria bacterium]
MSIKDSSRQRFLQELYNRAEGDFDLQISMYDLGTDLGFEKDEAAAFAQELFIEGLAEMKTLSGGMSITQKGLKALNINITPKKEDNSFILGSSPVLDEQGQKAIQELLNKIRTTFDSKPLPFDLMEEIVIDLKTIEVQMLSPNPKTRIIREVFKFIDQNLKGLAPPDLQLELQTITAKTDL